MAHKCPTITGSNDDPEFRRERARRAGQARQSPDAYITALVKRAPQLTENHRARLRALLASQDGGK
ncbi:hypothetical protein [Micromonospora halophytica]|uniref:Uncharacterized protein n=1 Tax=Micromonospora halophytica TaxID=47864 RepID=A0A1C5J113_9ACTN|nr:hypothetical protein [Micromonospora halophytica]SCG63981.1 hypothetical protein GA0070560_11969 [Micromonospora halophytica]